MTESEHAPHIEYDSITADDALIERIRNLKLKPRDQFTQTDLELYNTYILYAMDLTNKVDASRDTFKVINHLALKMLLSQHLDGQDEKDMMGECDRLLSVPWYAWQTPELRFMEIIMSCQPHRFDAMRLIEIGRRLRLHEFYENKIELVRTAARAMERGWNVTRMRTLFTEMRCITHSTGKMSTMDAAIDGVLSRVAGQSSIGQTQFDEVAYLVDMDRGHRDGIMNQRIERVKWIADAYNEMLSWNTFWCNETHRILGMPQ